MESRRPDSYYAGVFDSGYPPPPSAEERAAARTASDAVTFGTLVEDFRRATAELEFHQDALRTAHLRRREIVLAMQAEGLSYRRIGALLDLASSTVFMLSR